MGYMGLVATKWVPMATQVPVLLPNDNQNVFQGQQKSFGRRLIFKSFQVPRDNLNNCNFEAFRGPVAQAK